MIFSFYSKAERNGEIRLGPNKILHLWCGSLQGSLRGWQRRLQTAPCLYPSLLLPPSLCLPHTPISTPCSTIRFLSISVEGDEEKGRRVVLINGRKPDDGKERCETDRPHNLPSYQDTTITYLFLSIYFLLLSVFNSHTQSARLKHSPDTTHTNVHLTANMLQKNKRKSYGLWYVNTPD